MSDEKIKETIDDMQKKITEVHTVLFLNGMLKSTKDTQEKLNHFLEHRGETCPVVLSRITHDTFDRKTLAWGALIIALISSLPSWIILIFTGG